MMILLARDKKLVTLKNNTSTLVILQGHYCERSLNLIKMVTHIVVSSNLNLVFLCDEGAKFVTI